MTATQTNLSSRRGVASQPSNERACDRLKMRSDQMRGAVQFLGAIALGMIVVGVLAYYGGAKEIGGAIGGLGGLVLAIALPFLILVPVVTDILGTLADLGSDVRSLANREENAPVQGRTDL